MLRMSLPRDGCVARERTGAPASGPWKQMEGTRLEAGSGPFLPRKPLAGGASEARLFARPRNHSRHRPDDITASGDLPRRHRLQRVWNRRGVNRRADRGCARWPGLAALVGGFAAARAAGWRKHCPRKSRRSAIDIPRIVAGRQGIRYTRVAVGDREILPSGHRRSTSRKSGQGGDALPTAHQDLRFGALSFVFSLNSTSI